ncbi:glycosyltransferase family 2 protein [Methylobacter tundripaludum]|uniref:Glycosyl transferase family 2 n=1 Tax=Methylobacter tundripaludum (strain ATCC BAA-1195 / DSM 17260 / SV96) TaxID=697282 RepID=G3J0N2_METTV|nr:glycosyltransferase family A protein [Methylobacter tundripaludum]EGW20754.1 glycosyl transferase family 2 [Methylobacter tundripaludum SV96]
MSTVDVVIPCYNYARYLSACVHSVLSQCGVNVRVLVIDDCSSDNTAQIGQELAAADSRVEFRRHEVNKGHIATYNEGLMGWSAAEYSVLLSADDLLVPGSLSRAVQIMDIDKSIGLVYGRSLYFAQEDDIPRIKSRECSYTRWLGTEWLEGRCQGGHNVISSPEVVVRGTVQRAVGGYRPELPHTGDLEMWLRIAAVSNIAYVRGVPQAYYRVHAASMQRTKYQNKLVDLQQRKAAFDSFFQHHQNVVTDAYRLHDLANRALAREALWEACRAYDRNEVEECAANELERFATTTYPKVTPESVALRRRRFVGPIICNRTQVFAIPAIVRRVCSLLRHERWKWQGI